MSDLEEKSALATDDTTVSDDATSSTNEDTQDTESSLEDIEVSEEDISSDDGVETDESKESEEDKAATESTDDTEEESKEDESTESEEQSTDEAETDEESTAEDTTTEEEKQRAAKVAFEQREATRRAQKSKSQQDYIDLAEDDKDLALRQLQVDAYNNRVEGNSNKLQNGIDKAVAAIDLFQSGSPEVKSELANSLDDFERMYVKRDDNGDPIEVTGDVYQYLTAKADSIKRLTGIGARQQETNKAKQKARTLTPPAKTPKAVKKDDDFAAFDEEATKY